MKKNVVREKSFEFAIRIITLRALRILGALCGYNQLTISNEQLTMSN
ncbi:MAG: hypothetical protein M0Q41_11510 [Bacteroidales bacterium]|nr:hypothetical protein [Bacteroidales bacterium]